MSVGASLIGDERGWEGWSEEREAERRAINDAAMLSAFGALNVVFEWGAATSLYDARTGYAAIWVTFKNPGIWRVIARRLSMLTGGG